MLEVRMGIEIESAGLAAVRRSASQDAAIHEAYNEFDRLLALGIPTGKTDFAIHRAIAAATNNPFYIEVLDALGSRTIPCDVASPWGTESVLTQEYQTGLQREHKQIIDAISDGDADAAREAMRQHLSRSQDRYRLRLGSNPPIRRLDFRTFHDDPLRDPLRARPGARAIARHGGAARELSHRNAVRGRGGHLDLFAL